MTANQREFVRGMIFLALLTLVIGINMELAFLQKLAIVVAIVVAIFLLSMSGVFIAIWGIGKGIKYLLSKKEIKMDKNLKELLRKTFSVDTEAGHRLRYHIIRASACKDYKTHIAFNESATGVGGVFIWSHTEEGVNYWLNIDNMVARRFHQ